MANNHNMLVFAEAGVNHSGSLETAKRLADVAKSAGADVVKYQVFKADKLAKKGAAKADYQVVSSAEGESQADMPRRLELSFENFCKLKQYCSTIGVKFLATSFDSESAEFLIRNLGVRLFIIPSCEMDNYPYLVRAAGFGIPIIMSTGMSSIDEIRRSVEVLREYGASDITVLHCSTQYPIPYGDMNLRAIPGIGMELGTTFGHSDHTIGIEAPVADVALGASVIEKHFISDRSMEGSDHKASLEPHELADMAEVIRNIEVALGDEKKRVISSESGNRAVERKSIVAAARIEVGERFTGRNLTTMRPGTELSPMLWPEVIGLSAKLSFELGELIEI